jgi:hypothetical protein
MLTGDRARAARGVEWAAALAWEASFQVWRRRARLHMDSPMWRAVWGDAPLAVRVQQAERWLRNEQRERAARQASVPTSSRRRGA